MMVAVRHRLALQVLAVFLVGLPGVGQAADGAASPIEAKTETPIPYVAQPALDTPSDVQYQMDGYLQSYAEAITKNWLMVMEKNNPDMLEQFRNAATEPYTERLPWSGEFPGKHLTGAVEIYRLTHDK